MASKYALHPDFSHMEDSKKNVESKLLLNIGNMLIRKQTKGVEVDANRIIEEIRTINGYQNRKIKLRVFSPAHEEGELPCIVYFHGGAWVGDVLPHQVNYALFLAEYVKCRFVLVEYSLALKHPFPAGTEDSYAALQWVFANAHTLKVDPSKIAVYGDSSGGNYAAAVCLMARDRGGAMPCYQMLLYPAVDSSCSSESANKYLDTPELNSYGMKYAWRLLLANGDAGMLEYASPIVAKDLTGLPEAYVETAEFDPLHDEGIAYSEKLKANGIDVILNETTGTYHGFDIQMKTDYSIEALKHRGDVLRAVFAEDK